MDARAPIAPVKMQDEVQSVRQQKQAIAASKSSKLSKPAARTSRPLRFFGTRDSSADVQSLWSFMRPNQATRRVHARRGPSVFPLLTSVFLVPEG